MYVMHSQLLLKDIVYRNNIGKETTRKSNGSISRLVNEERTDC